ncbi:peptidase C39 family protein [Sporomusa aerivorans]|uniref:peptidase C39 family protein n=1 Tax=Sporomusa aerivorans TaxID=204936 RepID=UPI00352A77A9
MRAIKKLPYGAGLPGKIRYAGQWKIVLFCLVFFVSFVSVSFAEEAVLPLPSSTGAANYYEMKPNPYFVSLGVKGYQQTTDYTCGPAAAMSLMRWYSILSDQAMNPTTELLIAKGMGTGDMHSKHPGTNPQQMAAWLKQNGFEVTLGYNGTLEMLRDNLKKGIPTLVEWIDWGGHWVVVTGYYAGHEAPAKGVDTIFFADPAVQWTTVNNPDGISSFNAWRFRDMWFDAQYFKPGNLVRNVYIVAVPKKI